MNGQSGLVATALIIPYQIQRAHAHNPTHGSKNITPTKISTTTFRCCVDRVLVWLATLTVRSIAAGATPNVQAKISAVGNSVSTSKISSRKLQPGHAQARKTVAA